MKTNNYKKIAGIFVFLLILSFVAATTASIGNSRMVLRLDPGEKVEKSILVKNVNDHSVNIEMMVSGNLTNNIKLDEETFELQPGEEKKAYFTITAPKTEGTTESKINIKFIPEEGNAVGLASTVIVVVGDSEVPSSGDSEADDSLYEDTTDTSSEDEIDNSTGVSFNLNNKNNVKDSTLSKSISPAVWLGLSTLLLVIVLAGLFVVYKRRDKNPTKSKKSSRNI